MSDDLEAFVAEETDRGEWREVDPDDFATTPEWPDVARRTIANAVILDTLGAVAEQGRAVEARTMFGGRLVAVIAPLERGADPTSDDVELALERGIAVAVLG